MGGGLPELGSEHGSECARGGVSDVVGDFGDSVADGQEPQGFEEAVLATPLPDGHAGLGQEQALDGSSAGPDGAGQFSHAGPG
jgi:hypothetical protein